MDAAEFIIQYRFHLAFAVFMAWVLYALYHTGKLRLPRRQAEAAPVEQRLAAAEAEAMRLQREKERLTLAIAKMKREKIEREIRQMAEEKMQMLLPQEVVLLDPVNQPIGRPIYYVGSVPVIDKRREVERMAEGSILAKLAPSLAAKLLDALYFKGDTLYFYGAILLPNGKWALAATSKPARASGGSFKLPPFTRKYILLTTQQQSIDDLITNKWEVTHARAAIVLSSTVLGPFPVRELSGLMREGLSLE